MRFGTTWMRVKDIKKGLISLIIFVGVGIQGYSQEIHGNTNVWFLVNSSYRLNSKFSLANELHMRFDDVLEFKQQFLVRPFINYHRSESLVYSFGYTFINTFPYGDYPVAITQPEHNIWEQITLIQNLGKTKIQHRYRWENRWSGIIEDDLNGGFWINGFDYSNRFRYRITATVPLTNQFFINIFDEFWVRELNDWSEIDFDRNWLYIGFGFKANESFSFQLAYMSQYIQNNPTRFERHPTFQLTGDFHF